MILHTVNKSPYDQETLSHCLDVIRAPAVLLLIENGVYAALNIPTGFTQRLDPGIRVCALAADVDARGLRARLDPTIEVIDDKAFVDLTITCDKVQSWY